MQPSPTLSHICYHKLHPTASKEKLLSGKVCKIECNLSFKTTSTRLTLTGQEKELHDHFYIIHSLRELKIQVKGEKISKKRSVHFLNLISLEIFIKETHLFLSECNENINSTDTQNGKKCFDYYFTF